ncbi:MAG: VOC family protein [Actinobacteria bacterium]|nr:VOC family protein [Actinomycetota bacterium]
MDGSTRPFWLTAFIDYPAAEFERGRDFWTRATGWPLSAVRGEHEEFVSLVPPDGADYLRLQRLGGGRTRLHLDVHVLDPDEAAFLAQQHGASLIRQVGPGLVIMASPAGFEFCFVRQPREGRPRPRRWPAGHHSAVSQVCLDIPSKAYAAEVAFWAETLACPAEPSPARPEFTRLQVPQAFPFELLTQRLELSDEMGAHLDIGTDNRPAEVARLQREGAVVRAVRDGWTVLEAPGGLSFCVLDRHPVPSG